MLRHIYPKCMQMRIICANTNDSLLFRMREREREREKSRQSNGVMLTYFLAYGKFVWYTI